MPAKSTVVPPGLKLDAKCVDVLNGTGGPLAMFRPRPNQSEPQLGVVLKGALTPHHERGIGGVPFRQCPAAPSTDRARRSQPNPYTVYQGDVLLSVRQSQDVQLGVVSPGLLAI